jgi:hypothetical protein
MRQHHAKCRYGKCSLKNHLSDAPRWQRDRAKKSEASQETTPLDPLRRFSRHHVERWAASPLVSHPEVAASPKLFKSNKHRIEPFGTKLLKAKLPPLLGWATTDTNDMTVPLMANPPLVSRAEKLLDDELDWRGEMPDPRRATRVTKRCVIMG